MGLDSMDRTAQGIDMVGRNTFRMKRTINMDLRISKRVKIRENMGVEMIGKSPTSSTTRTLSA
jgi:hypothetical protein